MSPTIRTKNQCILDRFRHRFWFHFGTQNALKITSKTSSISGSILERFWLPKWLPKWSQKGVKMKWGRLLFGFQNALQTKASFFIVFDDLLGSLWPLFQLSGDDSGTILAASGPPEPPKIKPKANRNENPPRTRCKYAENLPRTAKNPSRSAENLPRTSCTNPKHKYISQCNGQEETSFRDKRPRKGLE